jgi:hypothetical protein
MLSTIKYYIWGILAALQLGIPRLSVCHLRKHDEYVRWTAKKSRTFCHRYGLLRQDFLPPEYSVTVQFCVQVLQRLCDAARHVEGTVVSASR